MRILKPVMLSFAIALFSFPALAADKLAIKDAYSFAVPDGAKNAAAFMTITYPSDGAVVPDRILRAESAIAEQTQIHTMLIENDVMTMRAVDSFPLPPTGSFALNPKGAHIMFMGLNRKLAVGDHFPVTLVFEKAGSVTTDVTVRAAGDIPGLEDGESVAEPAEEKDVHQDVLPHEHHH